MKKLLFIVSLLFCVSINSGAQIRANACFDNYWGEWEDLGTVAKIKGNYDGFIIYIDKEGPWEYRFKFTINNMMFPEKKQRKKDIKTDTWYTFRGTVEYYISDDYPTILSLFRGHKRFMLLPAKLTSGRPTKKITSRATIKIAPFKDLPQTYNIWFDNVGVAINLNGQYFPNVEFK